jgi:hypothetical protein
MSTRAFVLLTALAASALAACSGTETPAGVSADAQAPDAAPPAAPKFPASLAAIDGSWTRVAGGGEVDASLSGAEMAAALADRLELMGQTFVVKDGVGISYNDGQGKDLGDETFCRGDREITFSVDAAGAWSVVEGAPRVYSTGNQPATRCRVFVGYATFGHKPLLFERVELLTPDRLLFVSAPRPDGTPGRVWAQVFARDT